MHYFIQVFRKAVSSQNKKFFFFFSKCIFASGKGYERECVNSLKVQLDIIHMFFITQPGMRTIINRFQVQLSFHNAIKFPTINHKSSFDLMFIYSYRVADVFRCQGTKF